MLRETEALTLAVNHLMQNGLRKDEFNLTQDCWEVKIEPIEHLAECWHDSKLIVINNKLLESRVNYEQAVKHEIAHALVGPGHDHDTVWRSKARELGCNPDKNCKMNGKVVRKHVPPLTQKCPKCDKVAQEESRAQFPNGQIWLKLKCGHLVKKESIKGANIENWTSQSGKVIYPYQAEGINFIAKANGRALIADEPGLGKTAQALGFLKHYEDISVPAIYVCKGTLKMQAMKEDIDWCGLDFIPCTIDSSKSFILDGMKLYIVSMDLLGAVKTDWIRKQGIKTVIVDEVQHFKNDQAKRTQELRRIVQEVDFFIALSGTPWKNRASEYYPVLNMLDPVMFPTRESFQNRWVEYYEDKRTGKWREGGIRNIPEFRKKTESFIIRRMRDDVLPDLPKINRQIRYVELEKFYGDNYEKAEGIVAERIKQIIIDDRPMSEIMGELMRLKHITGLAKIEAQVADAIELLEGTEPWEKVTIFHHHRDVGDEVEKQLNYWLNENGYDTCLRLEGGVDSYKRHEIIETFKREPNKRVLIASTLASGEGLNIQFCTNAFLMERQWNPQNEEQAEFRFSRPLSWNDTPEYLREHLFNSDGIPRKTSIRIPYLVCEGTIDTMLTEIIERKRHNYKKSMNDRDMNLQWDENEIINELAQMIMKRRLKK